MADPESASWPWTDLLASSALVRSISVVCLALGTIAILPFVVVVSYDLLLWAWRHYWRLWGLLSARAGDTPTLDASAVTTAADARGQHTQATHRR